MRTSQSEMWSALCWALPVVVVSALVGCGEGSKSTAHLQGAVSLGGKPLPADATAHIQFIPAAKGQAPATSVPITNGKYDAPAVPLGAVRVFFNVTQPTGPEFVNERGAKERAVKDLLSAKHGSGIEMTVDADNAQQDFEL